MKPRTQMRFLFVMSGLLALTAIASYGAGQRDGAIIPAIFAVAMYFGGMFCRSRWLREESSAKGEDDRR